MDSTLLWYFDAFYSQVNSKQLLSISKNYFEADFFSIGGSEGFLVMFDLKLTLATSAC